MKIDAPIVKAALGLQIPESTSFDHLGMLDTMKANGLSFIENARYLPKLRANRNLRGVFATPELARALADDDIEVIECDDPRYAFYALYNYAAAQAYDVTPSVIDPSASVHPSAYVAETNVTIGPRTTVDARAVVLPDVVIGADCYVGVSTVLGCDDAEVKRTSRGIMKIRHDGQLIIGDRVNIGAQCTIDKGFSGRDTVIGEDTVIANTTMVGHSARVGKGCFLLCCTLLGSTVVGDGVRINPGAIVSNGIVIGAGATISLGAVVVQPVPERGHVSGNFAIPHGRFLYRYAKLFGPFE
jgi:UDP-3-O-[3-hydroxymyristoyl] glucosamine N-acyltransferase